MGLFGPKKVTSVGTSNSGTCAQCGRAFSSGGQKIINGGLTADGLDLLLVKAIYSAVLVAQNLFQKEKVGFLNKCFFSLL